MGLGVGLRTWGGGGGLNEGEWGRVCWEVRNVIKPKKIEGVLSADMWTLLTEFAGGVLRALCMSMFFYEYVCMCVYMRAHMCVCVCGCVCV